MARRLLADPASRPLIDQIARLVIAVGSVNRLQQHLTSTLAEDRSEGWIYPNRLHTLLSEDPAKAVNSETIDVLEKALGRLGDDAAGDAEREAALREPAHRAWAANGQLAKRDRLIATADRVGVPPASARLLLEQAGLFDGLEDMAPLPARLSREPDWTFQDEAVAACLGDLQGESAKVGLILPTGGGKTRVATRIMLRDLHDAGRPDSVCLWVTHRTRLKTQALREVQRAMSSGTPDVPEDAVALLGEQVEICMLQDADRRLAELGDRVRLVVIDEAHHAAAPSYQPILERDPLRVLFLTATPNRTDRLPIGIDKISYETTYRELFERGVIIEPTLDALTIDAFDWNATDRVRDLADNLLDRAEGDSAKMLVVVSRVEHVQRLHDVLLDTRDERKTSALTEQDIGFVHGQGSSTGETPQAFLDEFGARPRGILVASSNLLSEGYDDPSVDTVVITFATSSLIQLMQAAGRCMRYAPGKSKATVLQLKDSPLAYHWEQRWLYQDISDELHPRLVDLSYETFDALSARVEELLAANRVVASTAQQVRSGLADVQLGDHCSVLLTGLPYDGPVEEFDEQARWGAVLVTPANRSLFLEAFNGLSARNGDVQNDDDYLRQFVKPDDPRWRSLKDMLWAMRYAAKELAGEDYVGRAKRPQTDRGSTWLTYATLSYKPALPAALADFLAEVVNAEEIATAYVEEPNRWAKAVKLPLPLGGALAYVLDADQEGWLTAQQTTLAARLADVESSRAFGEIARWRASLESVPLPASIADRIELLVGEDGAARLTLDLTQIAASATEPAAAI
jgi:superfamily II DNA or RNA helicase